MRAKRRNLAAANPGAAEQAALRMPIERLPPFRVVATYHPVGDEIDPDPLIRRLATSRTTIVLPAATRAEGALVFRVGVDSGELRPDILGIPSPQPSSPELRPDLVVAPVLAFDRVGGRLGQGLGCFDRTLAELRLNGPLFVVGLAFAGQEVSQVPKEAHDQRLDAILTEEEYIETRKDQ